MPFAAEAGAVEVFVVPSPRFESQHLTAPETTAQVPLMAVTPLPNPVTVCGVGSEAKAPTPSTPLPSNPFCTEPQHFMAPPEVSAHDDELLPLEPL